MRRRSPPKLLKTISMLLPCVRSAALVRQGSVRAVPLTRRAHALSMGSTSMRARSSDLPLFYNDVYRVELPEGHRFPMEKYRLVREVRTGWRQTAMTARGLQPMPSMVRLEVGRVTQNAKHTSARCVGVQFIKRGLARCGRVAAAAKSTYFSA